MIGFTFDDQNLMQHEQEELETANLDKRELYDLVGHVYFLPPYTSRGVTREYLLAVRRGNVFRVESLALRHFEVELTAAMTKRIGVANNGLLVRKMNGLLEERNQPPLGFEEFDPPDQVG